MHSIEKPVIMARNTCKQLISQVQDGDNEAFDILVDRYRQRIVFLVSRYLNDADDVQDVTQDTFIKAYKGLPKFQGKSHFYTWLYRIAVNTAKTLLKKKNSMAPHIDVHSAVEETHTQLMDLDTPEQLMIRDETMKKLDVTLEKLPPRLKDVIIMKYIRGMSNNKIAIQLDCAEATVGTRLHRACKILLAELP